MQSHPLTGLPALSPAPIKIGSPHMPSRATSPLSAMAFGIFLFSYSVSLPPSCPSLFLSLLPHSLFCSIFPTSQHITDDCIIVKSHSITSSRGLKHQHWCPHQENRPRAKHSGHRESLSLPASPLAPCEAWSYSLGSDSMQEGLRNSSCTSRVMALTLFLSGLSARVLQVWERKLRETEEAGC